jgi:3-hydroxyisobutyrate dehydrogenase
MAETIAVLETGTMGEPIARNLLGAGFAVRVWNRTREKAEPLGDAGAAVCSSPAEAASGAGFVLTTVADAEAVAETMEGEEGALGALADGAVRLQLATVGVDAADRLAELAAEHGVAFVDAPVLGTRKLARAVELGHGDADMAATYFASAPA